MGEKKEEEMNLWVAGSSSAGISTGGKVSGDQRDEEASAMYPMLFTSLSSLELPGLGVRVIASGGGSYSTWERGLQHLGPVYN